MTKRPPSDRNRNIVILYERGLNPADIAFKYDISRQRVRDILMKYGAIIPRKKPNMPGYKDVF